MNSPFPAEQGSLDGRAALVTGAGRGIGRATALRLAEAGAALVVNDVDRDALEDVVDQIVGRGGQARACCVDVTDIPDTRALVEPLVAECGVDILVANAGASSAGRSLLRSSLDETLALFRLNVVATLALCQLVIPWMRSHGGGDIVAVSSVSSAAAPAKSGPYTIAKAGLETMAWTLAKEEARHDIRVNVVAPALVDTRLGRLIVERVAQGGTGDRDGLTASMLSPDDVAAAVLMLVSDRAVRVSGQRVAVGAV